MIRACLCLLAGIYALQLSSFAIHANLIVVVLLAMLALLIPGAVRTLLLLLTGCLLFALAAQRLIDARIPPRFAGDSIVAQVRIVDFPERRGANVRLVAESTGSTKLPGRLRLAWYEPPVELRLGDVWQLELRLRRPRGNSNPGVFDYEAWLFREQVAAVGYVVAGRRNQLLHTRVLTPLEALRQYVVDRIARAIPQTERAAVLIAISVGARHLVTAEQWQRYAKTGTSHLMAISGLHVGMVAAGAYVCMVVVGGLVWRRSNLLLVATAAAVVAAMAYALTSGLAVPAQRAALMVAIAAVAVLRRRRVQSLSVVAAAALGVALLSPTATMAPGFKLSFAAVLVLIGFAARYSGRHAAGRLTRTCNAAQQLFAMQLLLLFGLLPLTVLIFGRIAFAAPLVNLVVVPVFSFVTVPLTLVGLLLDGAAHAWGDRALQLAAVSLDAVEWVVARAAEVPAASVLLPAVEGRAYVYLLVCACWVIFPPAWPTRGIAWVAVAALLLYTPPRAPAGCADIDVLDVGQGLAIVVSSTNNVLVFDTGASFRGGGSIAESVVLPFLRSRGINSIDTLIVSHADLDHAGGVDVLLHGVDVRQSRFGEPVAPSVGRQVLCNAGETWRADGIEYRFLHPEGVAVRDGNNSSCVLQLAAGPHRALLSGDIERPAEEQLLRSGRLQPVAIVIVPHHGSRSSSSPPFVQALQPTLAIVSAGFENRWGLPKADIVARWQGVGADVVTTATAGAIRMRLCTDGGVVSVQHNRALQRRIWHE